MLLIWFLAFSGWLSFNIDPKSPELFVLPNVSTFLTPFSITTSHGLSVSISCRSPDSSQVYYESKPMCGTRILGDQKTVNEFLAKLYVWMENVDSNLEVRYLLISPASSQTDTFVQTVKIMTTLPVTIHSERIDFKELDGLEFFGELGEGVVEGKKGLEVVPIGKWPPEVKLMIEKNELSLKLSRKASKNIATNITFKIKDRATEIESHPINLIIFVPMMLYDEPIWILAVAFVGFTLVLAFIVIFAICSRGPQKPKENPIPIRDSKLENSVATNFHLPSPELDKSVSKIVVREELPKGIDLGGLNDEEIGPELKRSLKASRQNSKGSGEFEDDGEKEPSIILKELKAVSLPKSHESV